VGPSPCEDTFLSGGMHLRTHRVSGVRVAAVSSCCAGWREVRQCCINSFLLPPLFQLWKTSANCNPDVLSLQVPGGLQVSQHIQPLSNVQSNTRGRHSSHQHASSSHAAQQVVSDRHPGDPAWTERAGILPYELHMCSLYCTAPDHTACHLVRHEKQDESQLMKGTEMQINCCAAHAAPG
jgi:hypothetical protein